MKFGMGKNVGTSLHQPKQSNSMRSIVNHIQFARIFSQQYVLIIVSHRSNQPFIERRKWFFLRNEKIVLQKKNQTNKDSNLHDTYTYN